MLGSADGGDLGTNGDWRALLRSRRGARDRRRRRRASADSEEVVVPGGLRPLDQFIEAFEQFQAMSPGRQDACTRQLELESLALRMVVLDRQW